MPPALQLRGAHMPRGSRREASARGGVATSGESTGQIRAEPEADCPSERLSVDAAHDVREPFLPNLVRPCSRALSAVQRVQLLDDSPGTRRPEAPLGRRSERQSQSDHAEYDDDHGGPPEPPSKASRPEDDDEESEWDGDEQAAGLLYRDGRQEKGRRQERTTLSERLQDQASKEAGDNGGARVRA